MKYKTTAALVALLLVGNSQAQTTTNTKATAILTATCQMSAQDMSFGAYDQNQDSFASSQINYRCTKGTRPFVVLSYNNPVGCGNKYCHPTYGGSMARGMFGQGSATGERLLYNIYSSSTNFNYQTQHVNFYTAPADGPIKVSIFMVLCQVGSLLSREIIAKH